MLLLHLASFIGGILAVAFAVLCLASGLLYIAEIIEENTQAAKRYGKQAIHVIMFAHLAFYLSDGFPLPLIALGIFSHLVYLSNFSRNWPSIPLTSVSFVSSCCLVIINHFAWFFYFADRLNHSHHQPIHHSWSSSTPFANRDHVPDQLTFIDITTFFALCVWLVPFFLFLSLSASDNVLPNSLDISLVTPMISAKPPTPSVTDDSDPFYKPSTPPQSSTPRTRSMLKGMLQNVMMSIPRIASTTGGRTSSRSYDGLLGGSPTPYQPSPSSPALHHSLQSSALTGSSPPTSPVGVSSTARRLSLSRTSASTSPRRMFSSRFEDHVRSSAPSSLHSPRYVASSASLSFSNPPLIYDSDEVRCSPKFGFDHAFPPISPRPTPAFH